MRTEREELIQHVAGGANAQSRQSAYDRVLTGLKCLVPCCCRASMRYSAQQALLCPLACP